ncbi:hypothetical protein FPSE_02249 [Fusarium pseudograminearum CS3096]|uniref:Uncharacterized protein n=1 Tax=Fusarium pseudograminearum (strain CS3096) TaxID=1028729 RepID=K3UY98_FUSPC|nr:hypothetical protein FPSE_02249 [Fusarium pseudograminearum CS3096]EKJ77751.1 hypothetical protein FPSE_02249 [Fusarium pseudograminearum CS3096]
MEPIIFRPSLCETILSDPGNPQTDSPLFSIVPAEVRDKIFSYALTDHPDPRPHMQYSKQTYYTRPSCEADQSTDTRLLRTCRAVYRETCFKPFYLREHMRWATAPDRAPPGRSGFFDLRHMLSRIVTQLPVQDKLEIERLRVYVQMYKLEEGVVSCIVPSLLAPRIHTLTFRHTDWWFWEDDEPLRFAGDWIEDVGRSIHWCTKQFCIELESLERKKDQVDKIADHMVKKWYFKRLDGPVLYADASGGGRKESRWSGDSTWDNKRWVRDETEPGRIDYYIVSVTFRSRIDIERSGGTVDRDVIEASQKDWFDPDELKIHLKDESRIEDPSPFEYVGEPPDDTDDSDSEFSDGEIARLHQRWYDSFVAGQE